MSFTLINLATIFLLITLSLSCNRIQQLSPSPSEIFFKVFGGPYEQKAADILQTEDAGFLLLGSTTSFNDGKHWDMFLVQTDADGNEIWSQNYDLEGDDIGNVLISAHDEGYILCGTSTDIGDQKKGRLLKIDVNGSEVWPTSPSWTGTGEDVVKTSDGGYLLIGTTPDIDLLKADGFSSSVQDSTDILAMKVDGDGNEEWRKVYGYKGADRGVAIEALGNDRYALLGTTDFPENGDVDQDFLLILINKDGNAFHTQTYGESAQERAHDFVVTANEDIVMLGVASEKLQLQQVNRTLQTDWSVSHNGIQAGAIIPLSNGGYMLIGTAQGGSQRGKDMLLIQTDERGNSLWEESYGSSGDDIGTKVIPLDQGGFALIGTIGFGANTMIGLFKTDPKGRLLPQ